MVIMVFITLIAQAGNVVMEYSNIDKSAVAGRFLSRVPASVAALRLDDEGQNVATRQIRHSKWIDGTSPTIEFLRNRNA